MYGIGTVARLAQVSARTLRHYHEIGLLAPAHVDAATGYRHYTPDQVLRLHRILVLRDLGVPLSEIGTLLEDDVTVEQLRGILLLRRAEARDRLATQVDQLRRVELRLAHLERGPMNGYDVIVKRLEPLRVVALSADIAGPQEIAETGGRMWPRLHAALDRHRVEFEGISFMLYEEVGDPERPMRLTTALPVPSGVTIAEEGLATLEIPAVPRAATTVVRGAPDQFGDAFQALQDWIAQSGAQGTSFEREVYVDCGGPPETWVTELQVVLAD
ncbi:MerR family transcriptional regulator [Amycolatopsis circi]|uniref:MerR family transcriptional regulator n=1 Tax=Amycolatopsis circi TaxID=871959 RepID=UPI000E224429|nr:MerR family transcriptional regulator [Amycolatopsis circi]